MLALSFACNPKHRKHQLKRQKIMHRNCSTLKNSVLKCAAILDLESPNDSETTLQLLHGHEYGNPVATLLVIIRQAALPFAVLL